MPKQYEAIRDKFISEGMSTKNAKMHAAKIYNSKHHSNPVTRSTPEDEKFVKHVKSKMGSKYKKLSSGQGEYA